MTIYYSSHSVKLTKYKVHDELSFQGIRLFLIFLRTLSLGYSRDMLIKLNSKILDFLKEDLSNNLRLNHLLIFRSLPNTKESTLNY